MLPRGVCCVCWDKNEAVHSCHWGDSWVWKDVCPAALRQASNVPLCSYRPSENHISVNSIVTSISTYHAGRQPQCVPPQCCAQHGPCTRPTSPGASSPLQSLVRARRDAKRSSSHSIISSTLAAPLASMQACVRINRASDQAWPIPAANMWSQHRHGHRDQQPLRRAVNWHNTYPDIMLLVWGVAAPAQTNTRM